MSTLDETFREYVWNYFQLHALQRLKTFEFYITLSTATLAGFIALVQAGQAHKWVSIVGLGLSFLSFIFWKLEVRTRSLVKNAEEALRFLDSQHGLSDLGGIPHPLRLVDRDDFLKDNAPKWPLASGHFSYARCFRWVFIVFGVLGLAIAAWAIWSFPLDSRAGGF